MLFLKNKKEDKNVIYCIIEILVDGKIFLLKIEWRKGKYKLKSVYKDLNNLGKYFEIDFKVDIGNVVD